MNGRLVSSSTRFVGECPRPAHEFGDPHLKNGVLVGDPIGQPMPNGDQQSASDGEDGLVFVLVAQQVLERFFPAEMGLHGVPSRLHRNEAQTTPSALRDSLLLVGLAAVVHACAQAGITDQMFRIFGRGSG